MNAKRSKKLFKYTINENYNYDEEDIELNEMVQYNLVHEQCNRENMLNELLQTIRRLAIPHLCYLGTEDEGVVFEHVKDNFDHLTQEEHISLQKASSIVNVLWEVLGAIKDELVNYQD